MLALTRALRFGGIGPDRDWGESPILPRPLRRPARYLHRWFSGAITPPPHSTAIANAGLIALALLYGTVAGGHLPTVVQATTTAAGFAIRDLSISGHREATEMQIADALQLNDWTSLVGYDADAARQRIEALPWIKSASVRKAYPSALLVEVAEKKAAAIWQHDNDLTLVDTEGHAITEFADARFQGLPLLIGTGANTTAAPLLAALEAEPGIEPRVKSHILVGGRRWDLRLDNGVTVKLPEAGIAEALAALADLEARDQVLERDIVAVDLRIPDRIAFELTAAGAAARAQTVKDEIAAEKKGRRT